MTTFAALDISAEEEQIYRWLLGHAGAGVKEIARAVGMTARRTQRLLDTIESKGLVTYSPQIPRRYIAASPVIALEAMVAKKLDGLKRARVAIQDLRSRAAQSPREHEQLVEVISGIDAQRQTLEHMQNTARSEISVLVRLPIFLSRMDLPIKVTQQVQRANLKRGVRYRSIYDATVLSTETIPAYRIHSDVKAGEEVRAAADLPFKVVLADRRFAFIPLSPEYPQGSALVVRSSALVDALAALFEMLWDRAEPVVFSASGALSVRQPDSDWNAQSETLVKLLADGLPDKVIAQEMGVSSSTLNRRLVDLAKTLDAQSRFQLGWLAALRLANHARNSD